MAPGIVAGEARNDVVRKDLLRLQRTVEARLVEVRPPHLVVEVVVLEAAGFVLDYAEVRRADLTRPKDAGEPGLLALIAARLGRTRLIDNLPFDED